MPTLYNELRSLISAFDRNKIDHALCGGIAMAIHGRPRATVDIDILILSESLCQVLTIAEQLGYTIRGLDKSFEKDVIEIRRISKVYSATKFVLTLDMILVTDAIRNVWETRVEADWEERKLSVVSREGLIALKKISARPQDIADIAALQEEDNAKN
jgi:hypothetical protein